ncbi:MAG: hypothetical protein FWC73_10635 [Defluviitaleaceae bacterium]|nr:hypothetical protein [Defluviitaleaceae bacterium]
MRHFLFLLLLFTLSGCISASPITYEPESPSVEMHEEISVVEVVAEATVPVPFSVLYAALEVTGAVYEPAQGAYLGVWLRPDFSKATFEERTGKKHAVFALEHKIGAEFPTTWMLQSIAAQAAPLIILELPEENQADFPLAELAAFAYELGNFNLPAFIVFNPLFDKSNICSEDYVLLFRYTRIIFRTYAPMAVFVWHGYCNFATEESPFYPGHDVVDWVSISALAPQGPEGFIEDIPTLITPFYQSFQRYKPIILLPLGVSHFSRRDYVYRVPQAAEEIIRVYNILRDSFPRVRLVVYADVDISTPEWDDFSLSREEPLIKAYGEAITDDYFLSRLEPGNIEGPMLMRSPLHGYYYQGEVFIDREILEARRHRPLPSATKEINERTFVNTADIDWMKVVTDHSRRVIYVY